MVRTAARSRRRGGRRERNGKGSVYPIQTPGGKRWETITRDDHGNRKYRRVKTEDEAEAIRDAWLRRKALGQSLAPVDHAMAQLFDEWLDYLKQQVERGERSLNTWREAESYTRIHMKPALGSIDCRKLTVRDVERYFGSLKLAPKTRHNHRIVFRRALNVALRWGWVDQNVASLTDPIPVRPREVKALSLAKAQKLLNALKAERLYSCYVTAMYTGLRAAELAGLRVEDVDLDRAVMGVHQQVQPVPGVGLEVRALKTYASNAELELTPEVVAVLADTIGDRSDGFVWESAPGRPFWPTSITHAFKAGLTKAGLPAMPLHYLRHYFISFLPALDVHPAVAQKMARHALASTTQNVYTSIERSLQKQAVGRLHEALSNLAAGDIAGEPSEKLRSIR